MFYDDDGDGDVDGKSGRFGVVVGWGVV